MNIHCIKAKTLPNGWLDGTINGYRFRAKVYDTGSKYGIENGRISKLEVWEEYNRKPGQGIGDIISYERGWDKRPATSEHKEILNALLRYFKDFPTSKYWEDLAMEEPLRAKVQLTSGKWIKAHIHVDTDGTGKIQDSKTGKWYGKLDPVAVWELKISLESEDILKRKNNKSPVQAEL